MFKIRNIKNKGFYAEKTQGWTILDRGTLYQTWEAARRIADALERKPQYYEIIEIVDFFRG